MLTRPSLARSVPFWVLFVGSLASTVFGVILVVLKTSTMTAKLTDGSATGVEVYAGQSWVVFGSAFVVAGLVGLVAALALGVLTRFAPAAEIEVVEPVLVEDEPVFVAAPAAEAVPAAPPVAEAAPVAEETPAAAEPAATAAAEKTEG